MIPRRTPLKRSTKPIQRSGIKRLSLKDKTEKATKLKAKRKVASRRQIGATPAKLKKELDRVFSIWVRRGAKTCYTCGKVAALQCGHFVSRSYLATRWEPDNCRPQCWGCNGYGNGRLLDFEERLTYELGAERVKELKQMRHRVLRLTPFFYETEIAKYKGLLESK